MVRCGFGLEVDISVALDRWVAATIPSPESDDPLLTAVIGADDDLAVRAGNVDFVSADDGADRLLAPRPGPERIQTRA